MFGLGGQEILLLLVLGVLLFGRKLPELGRSVGKTMVEFKKGMRGIEDEVSESPQQARAAIEPEPVKPPQRVTPSAAAVSRRRRLGAGLAAGLRISDFFPPASFPGRTRAAMMTFSLRVDILVGLPSTSS